MRKLLPDPFVIALLATLLLATVLPARGGGAVVANWVATALILLLFFFHGAKLSRQAILEGIRNWPVHALILVSTFVMFPLLGLLVWTLFSATVPMPRPVWLGVLYLAALPSTVQSSIAFTSIARGNVPAAIASASASQVLGVFLTPPLVALLAGAHGGQVPLSGIGGIVLQVLVPFLAGQALRPWIGDWVQRHKAAIAFTDRGAILAAVYSAFSAAVVEGIWKRVQFSTIAILLGLCLILLVCSLAFTWGTARLLKFPRGDRIAILFCGTKKSLVQGVPIARVLFTGADVGLILLPIMIFHQLQLMACAWISSRYAREG